MIKEEKEVKNIEVVNKPSKTLSEETKKKISESSMGKPGTNTGKNETWNKNHSMSMLGQEKLSKRKFFPEQELEICNKYTTTDISVYRLAKDYDCNKNVIVAIFKRNNIKIKDNQYSGHSNKQNKFTKEQELEIKAKFTDINNKHTFITLAKEYGCGRTTIREILLRNGVVFNTKV